MTSAMITWFWYVDTSCVMSRGTRPPPTRALLFILITVISRLIIIIIGFPYSSEAQISIIRCHLHHGDGFEYHSVRVWCVLRIGAICAVRIEVWSLKLIIFDWHQHYRELANGSIPTTSAFASVSDEIFSSADWLRIEWRWKWQCNGNLMAAQRQRCIEDEEETNICFDSRRHCDSSGPVAVAQMEADGNKAPSIVTDRFALLHNETISLLLRAMPSPNFWRVNFIRRWFANRFGPSRFQHLNRSGQSLSWSLDWICELQFHRLSIGSEWDSMQPKRKEVAAIFRH